MANIRCPNCGANNLDVTPNDACWKCGAKLSAASPAAANAVPSGLADAPETLHIDTSPLPVPEMTTPPPDAAPVFADQTALSGAPQLSEPVGTAAPVPPLISSSAPTKTPLAPPPPMNLQPKRPADAPPPLAQRQLDQPLPRRVNTAAIVAILVVLAILLSIVLFMVVRR